MRRPSKSHITMYNTNGAHVNLETEKWNENRKNRKRKIILPSTKTLEN